MDCGHLFIYQVILFLFLHCSNFLKLLFSFPAYVCSLYANIVGSDITGGKEGTILLGLGQ